MKILVDIGHPAHVHLFRHFIDEMQERGNAIFVTVKDIPAARKLLETYRIPYINLGKKPDSLRGKVLKQLYFDKLLYRIVKRNRIEIGIGTSMTVAQVSRVTAMTSFILDDDDAAVQPLFARFAYPFADYLVSPDALKNEREKRPRLFYAGYHELAYLHPRRFQPDARVLGEAGLKPTDRFFLMRFNIFKAHHDGRVKGLSVEQKKHLISLLEPHGRVFITTEGEIEPEFRSYRLPVSPEKIHSLLYYAAMFVGDSQTMTSEAALLGVPALKCNSFAGKLSVPNEIEHKYRLCCAYPPGEWDKMCEKIEELLNTPRLKEEWRRRRRKMLADKIDVTAFLVWLIENYPESAAVMRENPDYRLEFKPIPKRDP